MRLIDANKLKKYIDDQQGRPFTGVTIGEAFKIMVDAQPTIERKTGIWRRAEYGYTCNQCGKTHLLRTAYCPSCVAEMDF